MNIFARIAQMESSRFVGGRAQTQALLRAPDKTRPAATTGACPQPASVDAKKQYHQRVEIVRLPAGSIVSIPVLESLDPSPPGFYGALVFALPISLALWVLIGLAGWGLVSIFL